MDDYRKKTDEQLEALAVGGVAVSGAQPEVTRKWLWTFASLHVSWKRREVLLRLQGD